jgi:hypothetical protein
MKRSLATGSVFGIRRAIRQTMKDLHSDSYSDHETPANAKTRGAEKQKKIRIVFENNVSARSVKIPIKHGHIPAKSPTPEFKSHNRPACISTVRATS